ncbi:hypothetical protein [Gryllotalpicola koreensis]|uniref:Uncharacterized protein n=1 Tax=Gryllotalpicola koreensis TaxID=993086 RepID=A0ABP7ZTC9_9MICO
MAHQRGIYLKGAPAIEWQRAIYRYSPLPLGSGVSRRAIGAMLAEGHLVNIPTWVELSHEFARAGFTPAEFAMLHEAVAPRAREIARTHPELAVEVFDECLPANPLFRLRAHGWTRWLTLVRSSDMSTGDAVAAVLRGE